MVNTKKCTKTKFTVWMAFLGCKSFINKPKQSAIFEFFQLFVSLFVAFTSSLYYYQCPDEIVPNKSTSTTLRNPSLAHKHDSSWFPVIENEPAESCLYVSGVLRKLYWSTCAVPTISSGH
jgi:hypothetical protein